MTEIQYNIDFSIPCTQDILYAKKGIMRAQRRTKLNTIVQYGNTKWETTTNERLVNTKYKLHVIFTKRDKKG